MSLSVDIITLDGKTQRGSHDQGHGKAALHLVSAWAVRLLDMRGGPVTMDALGCQKAIAQQIRHQGGDDVLALKHHQPTLHHGVQETFQRVADDGYAGVAHGQITQVANGHGRLETRQYTLITELDYRAYRDPQQAWTGLASIGMGETARETATGTTTERRYYLTSHTAVTHFAEAVRGHWGIENRVHYPRDMRWREDRSHGRAIGPMLAWARNLAIMLIRHHEFTYIPDA